MAAPRTHNKPAALTGRPRVQTKWVWGKHERRRWTVFGVKFLIFLGLPWLSLGGFPVLLFDIPARRYHVFGQIFWPQDFYMLGLLLATAALLLFITTSLIGRIFCGYACPHTLLTSLFMQIDHWIEGDRPARLTLDGGSAKPAQKARRVLKHLVWLGLAAFFGFTFVSYFVGAHELLGRITSLSLTGAPLVAWLFISGVTYLFAGHLRDWVCTTTCPYGRFQGAMQDTDSLIVTYDAVRGEPRGKTKDTIARGGCVDCGMCVTACPMGIDIRQGPQYECITCARCIDACNDTMTRIGAPVDLIRFASENEWQAHTADPQQPLPPLDEHRWWRPRLAWYGVVLTALLTGLTVLALNRPLLGIEVNRDRHTAIALADGRVSNLYNLKLTNKDTRPHTVRLAIFGVDGELVVGENPITLEPGAIKPLSASVMLAGGDRDRPVPFRFRLLDAVTGEERDAISATFVGKTRAPGKGARS